MVLCAVLMEGVEYGEDCCCLFCFDCVLIWDRSSLWLTGIPESKSVGPGSCISGLLGSLLGEPEHVDLHSGFCLPGLASEAVYTLICGEKAFTVLVSFESCRGGSYSSCPLPVFISVLDPFCVTSPSLVVCPGVLSGTVLAALV